jgi:YD repeat-containing protein
MTTSPHRLRAFVVAATIITAGGAMAQSQTFCAPPSPMPNGSPPPNNPSSCGPSECETCTASPCFAKTGVYVTRHMDLQIPTNGFPLVVSRSYESSSIVDGPLGYGWKSNLGARVYPATYLFVAPNDYRREAVLIMPDGEEHRFRENTTAPGTFTPPAGRRDTLTRNADGGFLLVVQHSNVRYTFAADGSLQSIKDDYGNTLRFTRDTTGRVSRVDDDSGAGRHLIVTWNPSGRINSIQDSSGRVVSYAYSTNGTLTDVTNPANQATKYTYEQRRFAPLLTGIRDHWNRAITDITYDDQDRVRTYTELGETYELTYGTSATGKKHSLGTQTVY